MSLGDHSTDVNKTIHVSGLPTHITEPQLLDIFSPCGPVLYLRILGEDHTVQKYVLVFLCILGGDLPMGD